MLGRCHEDERSLAEDHSVILRRMASWCTCSTDANIFRFLALEREISMRFVAGLCALLFAVLIGHAAAASPVGKRVRLLGAATTHPFIRALASPFPPL